jgi:hypothetical protein
LAVFALISRRQKVPKRGLLEGSGRPLFGVKMASFVTTQTPPQPPYFGSFWRYTPCKNGQIVPFSIHDFLGFTMKYSKLATPEKSACFGQNGQKGVHFEHHRPIRSRETGRNGPKGPKRACTTTFSSSILTVWPTTPRSGLHLTQMASQKPPPKSHFGVIS